MGPQTPHKQVSAATRPVPPYYALLGLEPSASVQEVRRAYREKSKLYHPDTTLLPAAVATEKFRQLNEAYATLSSPERRQGYDRQVGFSRLYVVQPSQDLNTTDRSRTRSSSAYLDATDRPLSPGELFALFILGVTFMACLVLAIFIGLTQGETAFQTLRLPLPVAQPAMVQFQEEPLAEEPFLEPLPDPRTETSDQHPLPGDTVIQLPSQSQPLDPVHE